MGKTNWSRRRLIAIVGCAVLAAAAPAGASTPKKAPPKKPVKHTRTVTMSYTGACGAHVVDVADGTAAPACPPGTNPALSSNPGEKYMSITVTDGSGRPVHAELWSGASELPDFCGSVHNYALKDGDPSDMTWDAASVDPGCPSTATSGTITIIYSNLP
jgi:hypothetical protein